MNRFALSCCALLLMAGAASAKPGFATATVNLRAEANTTSDIVAKIPLGGRVDVGDCSDGWCAVTYQDKSGFSIQTSLDASGKPRAVRSGPPGAGPNGRWVRVPPPGYGADGPPPGVVYGPGPYYGGPGPYYGYGPYWGYRRFGYGYGYGYGGGWRRW
jgi:Bacterial SH3 domain